MIAFYDKNNHSVFSLRYRIVLATKNRQNVISWLISQELRTYFENISGGYGVTIEHYEPHSDHVIIIFRAKPSSELQKFINAYKSASSRLVKKNHPYLLDTLKNGQFWAKSFLLVSEGSTQPMDLEHYFDSQPELRRSDA